MKKTILLLTMIIISCLTILTVHAGTNDFTITLLNEPTYTIVIPASEEINKNGEAEITIELEDLNLAEYMKVGVSIKSENYDNSWYMINESNPSDKIEYIVGTEKGLNNVFSGDEIIFSDSDESVDLYFKITDTKKSGTYTDTITFISSIAKPIVLMSENYLDGVIDVERSYERPESSGVDIACDDATKFKIFIGEDTYLTNMPEPDIFIDMLDFFQFYTFDESLIISESFDESEYQGNTFYINNDWNKLLYASFTLYTDSSVAIFIYPMNDDGEYISDYSCYYYN